MFTMIMLDIRDMIEKDKLFYFIYILLCDVIIELQRRRIQNLANAMTAAEWLSDYDLGFPSNMKLIGNALPSNSGSGNQSSISSISKSGGGSNGSTP